MQADLEDIASLPRPPNKVNTTIKQFLPNFEFPIANKTYVYAYIHHCV